MIKTCRAEDSKSASRTKLASSVALLVVRLRSGISAPVLERDGHRFVRGPRLKYWSSALSIPRERTTLGTVFRMANVTTYSGRDRSCRCFLMNDVLRQSTVGSETDI